MQVPFRPNAINWDLPASELPIEAASDAHNVVIDDDFLSQAQPWQPIGGSTLFAPRYLLPAERGANAFWVYAGDAGVGVTDMTTHTDITPAGFVSVAAITDAYSGGLINQFPVINARNQEPMYWDLQTTSNLVTLPGWTAGDLCESIRPFRQFLVAMNISVQGNPVEDMFRVSDAAPIGDVPQRWDIAPDSLAIERSVGFNPGGLVDGAQLLDRFYIYKRNSVYLLQLVGGNFIFSNKPAFSTFGALARNCIAEWRGQHIVLTDGDLIVHDGVNVQSLIDASVRKRIFGDIDGTNFENSWISLSRQTGELYVARPRQGEIYPSEAFVISLEDRGKCGHQVFPQQTPHGAVGVVESSSLSFEQAWQDKTTQWNNDPDQWGRADFTPTSNFLVLADYATQLHQVGAGFGQGSDDLVARAERSGIAIGGSGRKAYARRLWLDIDATPGAQLEVCVGSHDNPRDQPQWSTPQTFTVGTDRYVNVDRFGYYLGWQVKSTGQQPWRIARMILEVEPGGLF